MGKVSITATVEFSTEAEVIRKGLKHVSMHIAHLCPSYSTTFRGASQSTQSMRDRVCWDSFMKILTSNLANNYFEGTSSVSERLKRLVTTFAISVERF